MDENKERSQAQRSTPPRPRPPEPSRPDPSISEKRGATDASDRRR
jgi:hypothetical protein